MPILFLDKTASLTPLAKRIICEQATEYPHTGIYNRVPGEGTYLCRRCGIALFTGDSQFVSHCGWPSFDVALTNVQTIPDSDGMRTEIRCNRCSAHLGHVFTGENLTAKNTRYCVNAASIDLVNDTSVKDTEEAIIAGGCFWGVDYYLRLLPGVLQVEVGYSGGNTENPTYQEVCNGQTGHYEAVRVIYDINKTNYHNVIKRFFEIHDPTQSGGQGPDIGIQYQSAVFYYDEDQKQITINLIQQLKNKGYKVVTKLLTVQTFWPAEEYHQAYYHKHAKMPYCHKPVTRFDDAI